LNGIDTGLGHFPNQNARLKDNIDLFYRNGIKTIIWELSQDTDIADKSLLNAICETLK
jgi:hypothetical protein